MTNTTNTERLKPCPFCGAGNTEIRQNGRTWTGMKFSDPVSVSVRHWCAEVHGQPTRMIERAGRDEESAIAAWNTRAALAEAEGQAVPQSNLELAAAAVAAFRHRLSYNYSYTGEPAGLLKTLVADLDRALSNRPMLAAAPEAPAAPVVEPVAYVELTDAECDEFRRHQGDFNSMLRATHRAGYSRGVVSPPAPREPVEFTDTARSALLWVLWHHQGGSSPVGQPIRHALGIGRHEDLTDAQLAEAKRWGDAHPVNPSVYPRGEAPRERLTMDEVRARFDLPFISDAKAERISDALVELGIGADREGG